MSASATTGVIASAIAPSGGGDADADAIIAALGSDGVSLSGAEESAIQAYVAAGKSAGWWAEVHFLYIPIHGIAAANARNWVGPASSGTFSGSWTHGSGYVQGAAGAYFQMSSGDISGLISASSATLAVYATGSADGDNLIGWVSGTQRGRINFFSGSGFFEWCSNTGRCVGSVGGDYNGLWIGSRVSGAWYLRRKKTAGIASIGTASGSDSGSVPTSPLIAGGGNSDTSSGVTLTGACLDPMSVFMCGNGMSTALSDSFANETYTLLTAFGVSLV